MTERVETIVVGGGQAGLSLSYELTRRGCPHLVLEEGRPGETWRTKRWDSFRVVTPNWTLQLPGFAYQGEEPDGYMKSSEVVAYLDAYAESFGAPLRCGVRVESITQLAQGDGFLVTAGDGRYEARNVAVATGAYQRPRTPPPSLELPSETFQIHTSEYRRPQQLPPGAVLVVGGAQSGCQIAEELLRDGRTVYISVGSCAWVPRRYRGRDLVHWMIDLGLMDTTVDTLASPAAKFACNPPVTGSDGGHDLHPRVLERQGAILLGRLESIHGGRVDVAGDLDENLRKGDEFAAKLKRDADGYADEHGLDLPAEPAGDEHRPQGPPIRTLDLSADGITAVVWANGYRPAFEWINVPAFDDDGYPVQERGITQLPGLYFVGLPWLHKRKSPLFLGVGEDAAHVGAHIATRVGFLARA